MFKAGQKILVVGGSGFIGRHIVNRALSLRLNVTSLGFSARTSLVVSDQLIEHSVVDLNNAALLKERLIADEFDYVVNCGGYIDHALFNNGGRKNFENHLSTLINLVEAIDRTKLKSFVNIGSSDEYGDAPAPQAEHLREAPISPYSLGKVCASHYLQTLFRTEGFPGTTVRLFLTYGPGQDGRRFLPQIIDGCMRGVNFPVSAGEQLRDFCYIDDTVTAIFLALSKPKSLGEIINIASGNPVSIREMIETVQSIIGKGTPEFGMIGYRTGENMALYATIDKAKALLDWSPAISLEAGLSKMIEAYKII